MSLFTIVNDPTKKKDVVHIENILKYTLLIDIEAGKRELRKFMNSNKEKEYRDKKLLDKIWDVCMELCKGFTIPVDFFGYNVPVDNNGQDQTAFERKELERYVKDHCVFMTYVTLKLSSNSERLKLDDLINNHFIPYYNTIKDIGTPRENETKKKFYDNIESIRKNGLADTIELSEKKGELYVTANYKNFTLNLIEQWAKCPYNISSDDAKENIDENNINSKVLPHCFTGSMRTFNAYFSKASKNNNHLDNLIDYYINERIFNSNLICKLATILENIKKKYPDQFQVDLTRLLAHYCLLPNVFSRVSFVDSVNSALDFNMIADNSHVKEVFASTNIEVINYKVMGCSSNSEKYSMWRNLVDEFISYSYLYSFPVLERCFFILYLECFRTQIDVAEEYINSNIEHFKIDTTYIKKADKNIHTKFIRECYQYVYPCFGLNENIKDIYSFDRYILFNSPYSEDKKDIQDSDLNKRLPERVQYRNDYTYKQQKSTQHNLVDFDITIRNLIQKYE